MDAGRAGMVFIPDATVSSPQLGLESTGGQSLPIRSLAVGAQAHITSLGNTIKFSLSTAVQVSYKGPTTQAPSVCHA